MGYKNLFTLSSVAAVLMMSLASAKVGVGICPTVYPKVNDLFAPSNQDFTNGRYYLF